MGQAIHAFLAIDDYSWSEEKRLMMAARILQNWNTSGLEAQSLFVPVNDCDPTSSPLVEANGLGIGSGPFI